MTTGSCIRSNAIMINFADHKDPRVTVDAENHRRLTSLADASYALDPALAEMLLDELARAKIVDCLPEKTVGMGHTVVFRDHDAERDHKIKLVYPIEANIEERKISIFTPIGVALLGLQAGSTITFLGKANEQRTLQVLDVIRGKD